MSNITIEQNNDKFRGVWLPNTFYRQDDMVFDGTSLWVSLADFTSGATFDELNWFCPSCGGAPLEAYCLYYRDEGKNISPIYQDNDFSSQTNFNNQILPNGYLLDAVGVGTLRMDGTNVFFEPFNISNGVEMELTRQFISQGGLEDSPIALNVAVLIRGFNFGVVFNKDCDNVSLGTGIQQALGPTPVPSNKYIACRISRDSDATGELHLISNSDTKDAIKYDHPNVSDVMHGTFKLKLIRDVTYWRVKLFLNGVEIIDWLSTVDHSTSTTAMGFIHHTAYEEGSRSIEKMTDISVVDVT